MKSLICKLQNLLILLAICTAFGACSDKHETKKPEEAQTSTSSSPSSATRSEISEDTETSESQTHSASRNSAIPKNIFSGVQCKPALSHPNVTARTFRVVEFRRATRDEMQEITEETGDVRGRLVLKIKFNDPVDLQSVIPGQTMRVDWDADQPNDPMQDLSGVIYPKPNNLTPSNKEKVITFVSNDQVSSPDAGTNMHIYLAFLGEGNTPVKRDKIDLVSTNPDAEVPGPELDGNYDSQPGGNYAACLVIVG